MRNIFRARTNDTTTRRGFLTTKRFSLESLEDRLLLTAVPNDWGLLAEKSAAISSAGEAQVGLDVLVDDGGRAVIGLLVSSDGEGNLDPGMIRISDVRGADVTDSVLIKSRPDRADGTALFLLDIPDGEYELTLTAESAAAGNLTCSVFLPGDLNRDGLINLDEYKMGTVYANAWSLCKSGVPSLGVIEYYLEEYNIDLTDIWSVYNPRYDANMDGVVNRADVDIFGRGYGRDVSVSFFDLLFLTPNNRELQAAEGTVGRSSEETALGPDSFVAEVRGNSYVSSGYTAETFEQVGAVLSDGGAWTVDCSDRIGLTEDGRFAFDAASDIFDFLRPGQSLTLSFDYYLNDVTFEGLDLVFQDLYGGRVVVTIDGVNDAPRGASDYEAAYDLNVGGPAPAINVLSGIADPEGEGVTASIVGASLGANGYGIPTDVDYAEIFSVTPQGLFGLDAEALGDLLAAVPEGEEATFTISYAAADSRGASTGGVVTLTVTGKNDAPRGAKNYAARYDLESGLMTPTVRPLDGVTDPDGDALVLSIESAALAANGYGIPTDADYAAYFSVGENGVLTVSRAALTRLLQAVPAGESVLFTISYAASDPRGASDGGAVELTVAGRNEAPNAPDIQLTETLDERGALAFTVDLSAKVTDPDGDDVEATGFVIGGESYAAADVVSLESDGYLYTYDAEARVMTVAASPSTAENLRWRYNAADGTMPVSWFVYLVSDGAAEAQGTVTLSFRAEDDPAETTSNPADRTLVKNARAVSGDVTPLGTALYKSDRDGYTVSVSVSDAAGNVINRGALANLVTASVAGSAPNAAVVFAADDVLANQLETDGVYTVSYELLYGGVAETGGSFRLTVKDLQVGPWAGTVSLKEGEIATGDRALPQDGYTAEIGGTEYRSASFTVSGLTQVSAALSDGTAIGGDYASYLTWNADDGRFTFDASSDAFDFIPAGKTLTVAFDFYLDDLRFDGIADSYSGIEGGTVVVSVAGVNDAPRGAGNYAATLSLNSGRLIPTVNVTNGVTDPDGDALTARIVSAAMGPNDYGIATDADYASCFSIADGGIFAADVEKLTELLAAVPQNRNVTMRVAYAVSDPSGAETAGALTLTVVGRNESPSGAGDYKASYDAASGELRPSVNVLSDAADPDGDALTASVTGASVGENAYISPELDYSAYFRFDAAGNFVVDAGMADLATAIPTGAAVVFSVDYAVSDPHGASDGGRISLTVSGSYDAPAFDGEISDVSGGYGESVSIDLADYFSGTVSGYRVDLTGDSAILAGYDVNGSLLTLRFLDRGDYASNLNLSDLAASVTAFDAAGNKASSNTFGVSLDGAATLTLTLACVTEEFGGADVKTLRTGTGNFGTFYYVDRDAVPQTDYEAVTAASEYYLELWVNDISALLTDRNRFFYSIQAQLNYDTDGLGITALDVEDVYAGRTSLTNFTYYDSAETLLKDIQVTWLFSEDKDWSLVEPITGGENAFLLARFAVTADAPASISLGGVTDPTSPFVDGYYCVRTGETAPIDDSQIRTVGVAAAHPSSIRGAGGAEYVADGGVYLRTVTEKSATDAAGRAESIGVNADFIHEWQSHYAEIWVKGSDAESIDGVSVDLEFDPSYFGVAEIEFGGAFADGSYSYDAARGAIENISARAAGTLGADGYYLLARVKYTPAEGADLAWSASLAPTRLRWSLNGAELFTESGTRSAYIGADAVGDLWANPYDVNDDGDVNVVDFVAFVNRYGGDSTDSYAGASFDFNRDGTVDLRDFTAFSNVYGVTRADAAAGKSRLLFPESFTRQYLGSTLDADNAELVGAIRDAAVSAWNEALGVETGLDVTIVVKDLPDGRLAAAQAAETDPESGLVTRGIIYLDDDAAGARWSARLTPPSADSGRYDLYTVILHELGHLYGYDSENDALVSIADEFDWLAADGHSTDAADLMYPFVDPGTRKGITVRDAAVISALWQTVPAGEPAATAAARRDVLFAEFDAQNASWSLDFAEEVADALATEFAENIDPAFRDVGLDGDL